MKGKWKVGGKKKKGGEVLQKYMLAVDEFVKSKSGAEDDTGVRFVRRKSRKDLRKEKRRLKKARMKSHYEGLPSGGGALSVPAAHNPAQKESIKKDIPKSHDRKVSSKKPNKLQESRKKALLEANQQEDREIKKLERYLKLNKRKNKKSLPQSFVADGLDYILGALDSDTLATGMYDSDDNTDLAKHNLEQLDKNASDEEEKEDAASEGSGEDMDSSGNEDNVPGEEEEEDEEETIDDALQDACDAEDINESGLNTGASDAGRYVPPQMRNTAGDEHKAELEKLRKNIKGLVNRLSEPNLPFISGQLEALYMSCSRKDMNDTLTEVLLAACVTPALMPDRLLMEHVLLVSVLHHGVGLEVGAHFLEAVVHMFHDLYNQPSGGKECDNLLAIVAHLYNFQVVHSLLIFDILRRLVAAFTEKDVELVLFVLKNVGFSLRKDDALALKELISEAQRKAADMAKKFQDQTRVRFMLETMLALKNNDMRKIPGYDPEPVEKLKKLQRTLVQRNSAGSDMKLRVSLDNLLLANQVGRWWIVGSSWSGTPMMSQQGHTQSNKSGSEGRYSAKVLELARKQRMNTEVRRNIFCVLMTSEDYLDAFEKLLRMGLKDKQEREIIHVVMDCCLQEKTFNAFYAVLAEKLCTHDRRFQMTFQFSLWDKFRELSDLPGRTLSNLIRLVTHLLQKNCLSLSLLKVVDFGELDQPRVRFLRQVLTRLLRDTPPEELVSIFSRISGIPTLAVLREGLKLFISHFLLKNGVWEDSEAASALSARAHVATKAMEAKDAKVKL